MKFEKTGNKHLKRDPTSGVYYWRQYISSRGEFFKSTGERRSEARAERIGQKMFAEWLGTPEAMRRVEYNFADIAEKYLEQKKNRRKRTIVSAEAHVNLHLVPYFGDFHISNVGANWENYIAHKRLIAPKRKFYNDAKHLRSILRMAFGLGLINILPTIRNPDPRSRAGKEYTIEELRALLKHAGPDLALQIKLAVLMGMRRSEVLHLEWGRVDFERKLVVLRPENVKTDDGREVPIHPEVYLELRRRYKKARGNARFVFPSPAHDDRPVLDNKTAWNECKAKACVVGRFHDLRHTAVTRMLYVYNIPATKVAAIVGMSLAIMNRYAHPKGVHLHDEISRVRGFDDNSEE